MGRKERVWRSTLRYLCDIEWMDCKKVPGNASVEDKKKSRLERNIWESLAYRLHLKPPKYILSTEKET